MIRTSLGAFAYLFAALLVLGRSDSAKAQPVNRSGAMSPSAESGASQENANFEPLSPQYRKVQQHLAHGWNTWDVHSVTTHVLLPAGLAIHVGLQDNTPEGPGAFLGNTLDGGRAKGAEQVFFGQHTWDGSYTDLRISWKGHNWRIQSAHEGRDLALLATPLPSKPEFSSPPRIVFAANFLWGRPGTAIQHRGYIEARGTTGSVPIYCTCTETHVRVTDDTNLAIDDPSFSRDFNEPVGISTGKPRTLAEIEQTIERQQLAYRQSFPAAGTNGAILHAIESTLSWNTIYDPENRRVITPVGRNWAVACGGYVLFEWDTLLTATMASIGDRDLAYANAIEILRGATPEGFVPNYTLALAGNRKSSDRSQPPIGSMTILGLYRRFHDRWLLEQAFQPLLYWNRWWPAHRDMQGYLTWGSNGENQPVEPGNKARGTRQGAIYESGMDNSPMYVGAYYNPSTSLLEFADVGLMSLYIEDCDSLAAIAKILGKSAEAAELEQRAIRYRAKLGTMWSDEAGIFLNKNLHTGEFSYRLSPTNFYPLLVHAATPEQARRMVDEHLLNEKQFWGQWVLPSIERDDPAFETQDYWSGRIWAPLNYFVYLGLRNYDFPQVRRELAQKSADLFLKEWTENGHTHESYNAITGSGDDRRSIDNLYNWGALLGYIEYLEQTSASMIPGKSPYISAWSWTSFPPTDSMDRMSASASAHSSSERFSRFHGSPHLISGGFCWSRISVAVTRNAQDN